MLQQATVTVAGPAAVTEIPTTVAPNLGAMQSDSTRKRSGSGADHDGPLFSFAGTVLRGYV